MEVDTSAPAELVFTITAAMDSFKVVSQPQKLSILDECADMQLTNNMKQSSYSFPIGTPASIVWASGSHFECNATLKTCCDSQKIMYGVTYAAGFTATPSLDAKNNSLIAQVNTETAGKF